jgi:hypothetical protein
MLKVYYPNNENRSLIIITSITVGLLLYLLLIIYQPFGTSQFEHRYKYLLLFPYALLASFAFSTVNLAARKIKRDWTVGLELFKMFLIFLFMSGLFYFYNSLFLSKVKLSFENFLYMFWYTTALGFPIAIIYMMSRYIFLHKKYKPVDITIPPSNEPIVAKVDEVEVADLPTPLRISADYGNWQLDMKPDDFVYAEAVDNYCFIHYYRNGSIQKEIIRISLTKLLNQVQTEAIQRVHRSFIVNLRKVTRFKGNASGYKLSLENVDNEVMVSRSYTERIAPVLKAFVVRP